MKSGICLSCNESNKRYENSTLIHDMKRLDERLLKVVSDGGKYVPPDFDSGFIKRMLEIFAENAPGEERKVNKSNSKKSR